MNILESDKWKTRFLRLAYQNAAFSKDRSTQVGCIIVDTMGRPKSSGFNGMPMGVDDDVPARHERPEKYLWMEHSERNALYFAECSLSGCILIGTHILCPDCARGVIQKGISTVIVDSKNGTSSDFWKDKHETTLTMLREGGVEFIEHPADVELKRIDEELFVVPKYKEIVGCY